MNTLATDNVAQGSVVDERDEETRREREMRMAPPNVNQK